MPAKKPFIRFSPRDLSPSYFRELISARISSVKGELALEEMRTRGRHNQWLTSATESFSRKMELLLGRWRGAIEIDAKSLEYIAATAPNNPGLDSVARELIQARTQLRIIEARIAAVEAKIVGWQRALSAAELHPPNAYRAKTIEQHLDRLNIAKRELDSRRVDWQRNADKALNRSGGLAKRGIDDREPLRANHPAAQDTTSPKAENPQNTTFSRQQDEPA